MTLLHSRLLRSSIQRWKFNVPCSTFVLLLAFPLLAAAQAPSLDASAAKAKLSTMPQRTGGTSPNFTEDRAFAPPREVNRSYNRDFVVVKKSDGSTAQLPLLDLPVLFVKNSAEILDAQSRDNLRTLSTIVRDLATKEHAQFIIEGHTSAEGDRRNNDQLSIDRARAIQLQLAALIGPDVPACLSPQGFGPTHARAPATAPEYQLQQDRRVLVVRTK